MHKEPPTKINKSRSTPRHIQLKWENMIKKCIKSSMTNKRKDSYIQRKYHKAISEFFSRNFPSQRKVSCYMQSAEWEKYAAKNTLSSRAIIHNRRRDKEFPK